MFEQLRLWWRLRTLNPTVNVFQLKGDSLIVFMVDPELAIEQEMLSRAELIINQKLAGTCFAGRVLVTGGIQKITVIEENKENEINHDAALDPTGGHGHR